MQGINISADHEKLCIARYVYDFQIINALVCNNNLEWYNKRGRMEKF